MTIFRKYLLTLFILTSTVHSVHAQERCTYQECDTTGEAYAQSSYNSHWSAIVPLALIIGAAVWFGVADGNSSETSSHSKDGLGNLASRSRSNSYSSYSSGRSNSYSGHY